MKRFAFALALALAACGPDTVPCPDGGTEMTPPATPTDMAQPPCDLTPPKDLAPPRDCDDDEKKCTTTCVKAHDSKKEKCDRDNDDCYKRSRCREDRNRCDNDCDSCSHSCEKEHVVCTTTCTNTCNKCKEKR